MGIIGIIIFGLIVGFIARALLPGRQSMGLILTCLLGIGGALVGFFIFHQLLNWGDSSKFDLGGIVGAVIGAMLLLFIYDRLTGGGRRATAV
jgi:uncharacterized membrane protein YeaQ/YmgE (transglycosylase-associated protein family)